MNIKEQTNIILVIISIISTTLLISEYSKTSRLQKQIENLPPKHLIDKVNETARLLIEHLKNDKCLK